MLQVTSNYSKIFANCGVDLYTSNTFNDAISCLKMPIDLYTGSPYTRVYTVVKLASRVVKLTSHVVKLSSQVVKLSSHELS